MTQCEVCGGDRSGEGVVAFNVRVGTRTVNYIIAEANLCLPCSVDAREAIKKAAEKAMSPAKGDVKAITTKEE